MARAIGFALVLLGCVQGASQAPGWVPEVSSSGELVCNDAECTLFFPGACTRVVVTRMGEEAPTHRFAPHCGMKPDAKEVEKQFRASCALWSEYKELLKPGALGFAAFALYPDGNCWPVMKGRKEGDGSSMAADSM